MFFYRPILLALLLTGSLGGLAAETTCEVVRKGEKTPFDGSSLAGLRIDRKSLILLNQLFPSLAVVERAFKGEVQTCTNCTDAYVVCGRSP